MPGIQESEDIEKLYLHTDRSYYFPGDTIWFKGYYLDGRTQQLDIGQCNMYLDLIDEKGSIFLSQLHFIDGGISMGQVALSDSLNPGSYLMRVYTNRQKQLGEDTYFYKSFRVSKVQSSLDEAPPEIQQEPSPKLDLAFLPEGGFLLEGHANTVGIKVLDSKGRSVKVKGTIYDKEGITVAKFHTAYKGMTHVLFRPVNGKEYHISLENYPDFHYPITQALERGIKLEHAGDSEHEILLRVTSNSSVLQQKKYVFAIMHRGSLIYQDEFILKDSIFPIKLEREALRAGINRFILLDQTLRPISERLIFSSNPDLNHVQIESDRHAYNTRSPVEITLLDDEILGGMGWSKLSLSVVSDNAFDRNKGGSDILSWLLIDSELKGVIDGPEDFFLDDDSLSSDEKLNLLMLTQGWSRYLWNTLPKEGVQYDPPQAEGISLSGHIRKAMSKRPVSNGWVNCFIFSEKGFLNESTFTNEEGNFLLPELYFTDTVALFLQGYNQKGRLYTEVFLDPMKEETLGVSSHFLPAPTRFDDFPVKLYQQQYYNELALRDYLIQSGSVMLEEVSIKRKYVPKNDGLPRIYQKPRDSFKVTEKDLAYMDVAQFLRAKLGALFYAPKISFTGGASSFLYLLDGTPTNDPEMIMNLPMAHIDVVEFIRHYDAANVGMFGSQGAAGVVSVFTKKGGEYHEDPFVQGSLSQRITGFSSYREFYSPKYNPETIKSEKPDRRITLHWDPDIQTVDGKAELSFYTSDEISPYRIYVEGITNVGEICVGSSEIVVSGEHASLSTR